MAKRSFDQAFNGNWTKYLGPEKRTFLVVGVPQTLQGTGTGDNMFPEWSLVGTGNGNRKHARYGSVWSPREATESQDVTAQQSNTHAEVAVPDDVNCRNADSKP